MPEWAYKNEEGMGEEWELVIPGDRLYNLSRVEDDSDRVVYADDQRHEGVTWFLDFSRLLHDGEIQSQRFVTTEPMSEDQAKGWALDLTGR